MKLRHIKFLLAFVFLLASCNFTLAADVTPPPGYVPPTPMPTMGALFPANTPNLVDGAQIYMAKCAACHGNTGLGDGEKGKQLPVTVAPLGLADFARKAKPSAWFMQVTQGNLERFMPPFASLNDQEKWDVVAFALSLHLAPDQIEKGKTLFESKCADCAKDFNDPEMMYALTEDELVKIIKEGKDAIPAFGKDFTDDEAFAVAVYLRSLTFAAPLVAPTVTPVPEATATPEPATPPAETTPVEGTQTSATPEATADQTNVTPAATVAAVEGVGSVSGSIDNQIGAELPADFKVKLVAYGHGTDPNAGMQQVATYETAVNADGSFVFENIEIPENRIFVAEALVDGIAYKSDFAVAKAGDTALTLPAISLFAISTDVGKLTVTQAHVFFDVQDGRLQVIEFLNISNASDIAISIPIVDDQMTIVKMPANMTNLGFDVQQGEAQPIETADGFALPLSDKIYG
ncbi:MAG: c-type cytochrome, partial [Anaerolineales bacterium]|nr:c-type cytochrome [Anaerolineales bacterium]